MEEWVGERWHRFIWRAADRSFAHAAVRLEEVQRAVQLLFRAGGGDPLVRVAPASAEKVGGPRSWLQKLAGQGERASIGEIMGGLGGRAHGLALLLFGILPQPLMGLCAVALVQSQFY